jgi:hypothetical protein
VPRGRTFWLPSSVPMMAYGTYSPSSPDTASVSAGGDEPGTGGVPGGPQRTARMLPWVSSSSCFWRGPLLALSPLLALLLVLVASYECGRQPASVATKVSHHSNIPCP